MTARRTGIASVATLAALSLTVGTVHAVAPEWARRLGLDVWNASKLEAELARTQGRGHELDADGEQLSRQIEVSDRVTAELAAGRMSLADATAELERVNAARPGFLSGVRLAGPDDATGTELIARYALAKVRRVVRRDPSREVEVMGRLAAEYRGLTGKAWRAAD